MELKFKILGNWNELKDKLKLKFTKLTDEDLVFEYGKESELLVRLEKKLDQKREDIIAVIENLQSENIELEMDETASLINE